MARTPLVALVVTVLAALVVSTVGLLRPGPTTPVARPGPVAHDRAPVVERPGAVDVLRAWDAERSAAWAAGDRAALAALYVPGSVAGAHDAAMLTAWDAHGLRVSGLHTQLLAVTELGRTVDRWRLRVTDRLAGGVAVGPDGRAALPADRASTRTVVLQRVAGRWRVASVVTSTASGPVLEGGGASGAR